MPSDPKKKLIEGKRRALTIHDGARLTPALCRVLEGLSDEAYAIAEGSEGDRTKISSYAFERAVPVLVARADGIAVYVDRDGRLL